MTLEYGGTEGIGFCSFCCRELRAIWTRRSDARICQACTVRAFELVLQHNVTEDIWDLLHDRSKLTFQLHLSQENAAAFGRGFAVGAKEAIAQVRASLPPPTMVEEVIDELARDTIPPDVEHPDTLIDNAIPETSNG